MKRFPCGLLVSFADISSDFAHIASMELEGVDDLGPIVAHCGGRDELGEFGRLCSVVQGDQRVDAREIGDRFDLLREGLGFRPFADRVALGDPRRSRTTAYRWPV